MSSACKAVEIAKVNKNAINSMGLRIMEVSVTLTELIPTAIETGQRTAALDGNLSNLSALVDRAKTFVEEFGKQGYLRHVMKSKWDAHAIKQLDTDIGGAVADISLTLNVAQMRMQQRTFQEVEHLTEAIRSQGLGGNRSMDEASMRKFMDAAGCSQAEAMAELKLIEEDLEGLKQGQSAIIHKQAVMATQLNAGQEELKSMLLGMQDELSHQHSAVSDDPGDAMFQRIQADLNLQPGASIPMGALLQEIECAYSVVLLGLILSGSAENGPYTNSQVCFWTGRI